MCLGINSYHEAFVHPITINVQHAKGDTSEMLNFQQHIWPPLTETVLDESEF